MQKSNPVKKVLIGSYPGHPEIAETEVAAESVGGYCGRRQKLLDILEQAQCVKAVLSGHWHLFDVVEQNGILRCTGGSMVENPFEMRYGKISGSEIQMRTVALDDAAFSEISINPERKNGFTIGQDKDRNFVIPLK
ncbi:MAG: hypothetical protein HRU15_06575 [Planctomycetes bacterium]|nr:hypothetical protein [Planctomycetota bacterium]